MFTARFWPRVQAHPRNIVQFVRQCMIGQRVGDGRLVKKPTQFWANSPDVAHSLCIARLDRRWPS
eukprot:648409-Lingulodinium_polyedra.AAC.1